MESLTTESFNALAQKLNELGIAKEYFSHTLAVQTTIFSVIVGIAITALGVLTWFKSKNFIEKTAINITEKHKKDLKNEIEEKYKELAEKAENQYGKLDKKLKDKYKALDQKMDLNFKTNIGETKSLKADIARSYGYVVSKGGDQESYRQSLIWYTRSAQGFSLLGQSEITREVLNSAIYIVKKINGDPFRNVSDQDEFWNLFYQIDDKIYKDEKESLESEIKKAKERTS